MLPTNWYALRALRFGILYVVALTSIKAFALLGALARTPTMFDDPLRIAILAAIGIGWPTFAPGHFDWLRSMTFAGNPKSSLGAVALMWAPFLCVVASGGVLGAQVPVATDVAITWAIASMLALTDREHPGDRKRMRGEADDALRRAIASYEAIYGPVAGNRVPTTS